MYIQSYKLGSKESSTTRQSASQLNRRRNGIKMVIFDPLKVLSMHFDFYLNQVFLFAWIYFREAKPSIFLWEFWLFASVSLFFGQIYQQRQILHECKSRILNSIANSSLLPTFTYLHLNSTQILAKRKGFFTFLSSKN